MLHWIVLLLVHSGLLLMPTAKATDHPKDEPAFAEWADETLDMIDARYGLPAQGLYAPEPGVSKPDFAWGTGVQLSALAGAARIDADRIPQLRRLIESMDAYWHVNDDGLGGYDASAHNRNFDRYYDDNAWIVLSLVETYELTDDPAYMEKARETMKFVLSGYDDAVGGGVWWHEPSRKRKNACSTLPAAAGLLRLYEHDHDPAQRKLALELCQWTMDNLLDVEDGGLISDGKEPDGTIDRNKWSYNTALAVRVYTLLAKTADDADEERTYQSEAETLARAAEKRWVDPETGSIHGGGGGRFAHLLADAYADLSDQSGDPHWRDVAERATVYAHEHTRDSKGFYGESWAETPDEHGKRELIAQSSAARAYARMAWPRQTAERE